MPGTNTTNTFGEGLRKVMHALADLKLDPDADIPFIIDLETQIMQKLRAPIDQQVQSGASGVPSPMMGPPGQPPMGGPGGMPPVPGGMPTPVPMGAPGRGPSPSPQMPNPDELRRLLGASQ